MNRRHFITGLSSISAGLALGSPNRLMASSASTWSGDPSKPKKVTDEKILHKIDREIGCIIAFDKDKDDLSVPVCLSGNDQGVSDSIFIRDNNKDCVIIVGNSVATSIPDILLESTESDVAVMGEGDETILELLDAIKNDTGFAGIKGIYYKDNGAVVRNAGIYG